MVPPRASRQELYEAYIVDRLSLEEIRAKFGYHWTQNVTQTLKYYGVPPRPRQILHTIPLSHAQRQVALGTILGDAWIKLAPRNRHGILAMDHCAAQLPYLIWKLECLKPFASGKIQPIRKRNQYHGQTFSHPEFTELRKLFYSNGKKRFPVEILDQLGPLAVAVWYMDDGSYSSRRAARIGTCAFGLEATKAIARWFTTHGMDARHHSNGDGYWIVGFTTASTPIFHNWIRPYIPECMAYKVGLAVPSCIC